MASLIAMAGGSVLGGVLGGVLSRQSGAQKAAAKQMRGATTDEYARSNTLQHTADTSRQSYLERLDSFDPEDYARETAEGVGGQLYQGYTEQEGQRAADLRRRGFAGANVGAGRTRNRFADQLAQSLAALGMQAGTMKQEQINSYGNLYNNDVQTADNSRGRYLDLVAGNRDYETGVHNDRNASILGGASLGIAGARALK